MTVAIMQPYLFPYLGYYQLVNAVDQFVFFDDVNFINKGWINRNQILQISEPLKFTIPLIKASQNSLINEIALSDFDKWKKGFLKTIELNYKKSPYYTQTFTWLSEFFEARPYAKIGELASESIKSVAALLNLPTIFQFSSALNYKTDEQGGTAKILSICELLGANAYINPKNGMALYDRQLFESKRIELGFIHMEDIQYKQFKDNFVPNLSILDVLMFNSLDETRSLLTKYTLIN